MIVVNEEDWFAHYGTPRKSGRYPWGSGATESQRNKSLLEHIELMKNQGLGDTEIARGLGMTTTEYRTRRSIAKNAEKQALVDQAYKLHLTGMSNSAIGREMHLNESSVRALLVPGQKDKLDVLRNTSSMLKEQVAKKQYLDVGAGVENHIGVSREKLNTAIALLREEGYVLHYVKIDQLGTGHQTTLKVLTKPGVPYSDVYKNRDQIKQITEYSEDGGRSYLGVQPPLHVDSKRIGIRYAEQGGAEADGVIYVRPGVADVSLGAARYAQVRVAVDGSHYLKGMAMYKDDLPVGVDLLFNTNKSDTGNKLDAMKELKRDDQGNVDKDNPFGSAISKQLHDPSDPTKLTSAMNIVNEEGDWQNWSKNLSSQFLSKQSPKLAKTQLDMTYANKQSELEDIMRLTNPVVRKKLLESFADDADSSAVHLKAAILPRTSNHVILPINSMKETEIFAPNFRNGEKVVLVRHPHGGVFEIPELTVNNNHPEAKKLLGGPHPAKDAVGINSKVAEKLSGADFDGDTVLVIPNNQRQVKTGPALPGLKGFDPKASYPAYEGMPKMSARTKGIEMGKISNLITDMTIRGANNAELARAVRHSMVVIDAEKHNLNYRASARDNGIAELKAKYQPSIDRKSGASTLISRAGSTVDVAERKQGFRVDRETGRKIYTPTGASYVVPATTKTTPTGRVVHVPERTVVRTEKVKKLEIADDAHSLSSGTPIEEIYANHSNKLKDLANSARKEAVNTKLQPRSPSAARVYADDVRKLEADLNVALRNAPLERQAQVVANAVIAAKKAANPNMDKAELKKLKGMALTEARVRTGAGKTKIDITESQWEAIQAGALSNHQLTKILNNTDLDRVKKLATPKDKPMMTPVKKSRAEAMARSGYTQAEIADALGVSLSTLKTTINGE